LRFLFLPLSPLSTFYLICTVTDREKSNKKNSQFNNSMRGYKRYQRRLSRWQQEKAAALQKATYWTPPPPNKRVPYNGIFYQDESISRCHIFRKNIDSQNGTKQNIHLHSRSVTKKSIQSSKSQSYKCSFKFILVLESSPYRSFFLNTIKQWETTPVNNKMIQSNFFIEILVKISKLFINFR
jgi:hypothetical protein